jgi:iron complex outermembrane recepter protein
VHISVDSRFTFSHFLLAGALLAVLAAVPGEGLAQTKDRPSSAAQQNDLTALNIEDLMQVEVTSASKKAENLSQAPAAIFVVTGEDIRRGGFSSVPDALRMVPGMYVAQQTSHYWQVGARGFSSVFNNKMLVLIDGTLVYSLTDGGVWWDVQDPPLEDIERIEIIRGPGGTLWGANAVDGVINIITKDSAKTQGAQVVTSAGVGEGYGSRVRYGGEIGQNASFRVYGTANYWLPTVDATGHDLYDTWNISQGGMRLDWNASPKDTLTFDGQGYSAHVRDVLDVFSPTAPPLSVNSNSVAKGGHVLGRWGHTFNDRSVISVLGYCDWTVRSEVVFGDANTVCDAEFQHSYSFTARHSLTWGGSLMTVGTDKATAFTAWFVPAYRRDTTYGGFLQYDVNLVSDKLRLIAGSKLEHNAHSGFEYQPQVRAVWTPAKAHTLWAAASRAVRTPATSENDDRQRVLELSVAPPTFLLAMGDPNLHSEVLHAYESGYRYEWKQKFSVDLAVFYNAYYRLIGSGAIGAPMVNPSPFYIDLPYFFANVGGGQTHGLELYVRYAPLQRWTVSAAITELRGTSDSRAMLSATGSNPRHQVNFQSRYNLTNLLNFDAAYYYYNTLPPAPPGGYALPSWPPVNRVDVGLSTNPRRGFSFSVWGRNLQSDRHQEANGAFFPAGQIPRSVVFTLSWESHEKKPEPNAEGHRGPAAQSAAEWGRASDSRVIN